MAPKRKATSPVRESASKKQNTNGQASSDYAKVSEEHGIVNRDYYPSEMSIERCQRYNDNDLPRPMQVLESTLRETRGRRENIKVGGCVLHWFKRDLRLSDNTALSQASQRAKDAGVPLVCMFLVSPQDYDAHLTSPARVDFELRTLAVLQKDLAELSIPLYVNTIEDRKQVQQHIIDKCKEWDAKHIFCNIEYEVDELRRETKLIKACLAQGINFNALHDDVIVPPGALSSKSSGNQYSVYTPWYRAWMGHIHDHPRLLNEANPMTANSETAKKTFKSLFDLPIPTAPQSKSLPEETRTRLANYWPAGEHAAQDRLARFLTDKIKSYKDTRDFPALNNTSLLSPHFALGSLAARTAVRAARATNSSLKLDGGNQGTITWISEIAWRDFYKHVLAHWPYVCMNKAFKPEAQGIEWEYDDELVKRWCEGKTGYPIVDAAMRQLREMGWMHNRLRMIVGSFLSKDLLLDWRMGEQFFMNSLIDGDFASNSGGWGFSASVGVDPQPYFRIFNPTLQSERFDADGTFIRKWVPELKGVQGKAVHDPYNRGEGAKAGKAGYPKPVVEHKGARTKALEVYKGGLSRAKDGEAA